MLDFLPARHWGPGAAVGTRWRDAVRRRKKEWSWVDMVQAAERRRLCRRMGWNTWSYDPRWHRGLGVQALMPLDICVVGHAVLMHDLRRTAAGAGPR